MVATPWLWALGAMTAGSNLSFLLWPPSLPGGRRRGAARPKNPQAPAWGFWFGWPPGAAKRRRPLAALTEGPQRGGAAAFWRGQRPRQNRPAAGRSPAAGGWAEPTRRRPPGPLDKLQRQERPQPSFPRRKTKRPGMPSRLSEPLKKGLRGVLWQDQVHDHGGEGGDHHRGAAEHGPHPSGEAGKGAGNRGDALAQGHG